jgi:undecaprenyl-diphosphatase
VNLHRAPPLTPGGVLLRHPTIIGTVAGLSLSLGILAAVDGRSPLLTIDEPIQRWVVAHRSDAWTHAARSFSRLGSNLVVFSVFAVVVAWTLRRCRTLALTLSAAVLIRPPIEFVLKEVVDRDRPDLSRLVDGTGPSHPSGHVLAAVALWGLLPPLVSTFVRSRTIWWLSVATAGVLLTGIAASRVYLGVHWFTDVVQGALLGSLYLAALEHLFAHHHRHRLCALDRGPFGSWRDRGFRLPQDVAASAGASSSGMVGTGAPPKASTPSVTNGHRRGTGHVRFRQCAASPSDQ